VRLDLLALQSAGFRMLAGGDRNGLLKSMDSSAWEEQVSSNFAIVYVEGCTTCVGCGYGLIEMNGLSPIHWDAGHLVAFRGLRIEGFESLGAL